jgi:hypothetical protein
MRVSLLSCSLFLVGIAAACKSPAGADNRDPQAVVERIKQANPECTRLSLHCTPPNQSGPVACASTAPERKGKASDPEDLKAMQTGQTIVLDEAGALDVTVPIMAKDGKYAAACGVTLQSAGMTREQLIAKATVIAKAVETGLGDCCCATDPK